MTHQELLLPEGSVLLHIGPYKTGSTALQGALFDARDGFGPYGVSYPGVWRRAAREGWSVLRWSPRGRPPPPPLSFWKGFAADVRAQAEAGMRVCVSSEDFGATSAARAAEIVEDLGGERVHVVTVARRLDRLLPSAWQERVKGFDPRTYDAWLHEVLGDAPSPARKAFWRSQDVLRTIDRWTRVVDADRFCVVPADDTDRGLLFGLFEGLLGLPAGTLAVPEATNASLSANACELLRRVNVAFAEEGWSDALYNATVYRGAVQEMLAAGRSPLGEPIPPLPGWARERVSELTERRVAGLLSSGVRLLGDPATLRVPPGPSAECDPEPPEQVSLDQAAAALVGAVRGAAEREARAQAERERRGAPAAELATRELLGLTGRRLAGAARRRLARRRSTEA